MAFSTSDKQGNLTIETRKKYFNKRQIDRHVHNLFLLAVGLKSRKQ